MYKTNINNVGYCRSRNHPSALLEAVVESSPCIICVRWILTAAAVLLPDGGGSRVLVIFMTFSLPFIAFFRPVREFSLNSAPFFVTSKRFNVLFYIRVYYYYYCYYYYYIFIINIILFLSTQHRSRRC